MSPFLFPPFLFPVEGFCFHASRVWHSHHWTLSFEVKPGRRVTKVAFFDTIDERGIRMDMTISIPDDVARKLGERAAVSGRLVLSDFTRAAIARFKAEAAKR